MSPRVVLMDEPFSALDPALRKDLLGIVQETLSALGVPCIFVTHHAGEARSLADRVLLFDGGRIVDQGTAHACIPKREDDG
jgi:ABC-type proline/glycine betaine transport system ATPase subunit